MLETLIPRDAWPSAMEAGAMAIFDARRHVEHAAAWPHRIAPALLALEAESRHRHNTAFAALDQERRTALIGPVERGAVETGWTISPPLFLETLARFAAEAYNSERDAPSWRMIGYDAAPRRSPGAAVVHVTSAASPFDAMAACYDVVVIGAGAGGGTAAAMLAEVDARVLLVERGRFHRHVDVGRDHERTHRMGLYGFNTGNDLDVGPRSHVDPASRLITAAAVHHPNWYANAFTVGGGTRIHQGKAWRFHPKDFRLASSYGVPAGSSVSDWRDLNGPPSADPAGRDTGMHVPIRAVGTTDIGADELDECLIDSARIVELWKAQVQASLEAVG